MQKLLCLPTYILYLIIKPFLAEGHSLKKKISLLDWYLGRTDLCKGYDLNLWIWFVTVTFLLYHLFLR